MRRADPASHSRHPSRSLAPEFLTPGIYADLDFEFDIDARWTRHFDQMTEQTEAGQIGA